MCRYDNHDMYDTFTDTVRITIHNVCVYLFSPTQHTHVLYLNIKYYFTSELNINFISSHMSTNVRWFCVCVLYSWYPLMKGIVTKGVPSLNPKPPNQKKPM